MLKITDWELFRNTIVQYVSYGEAVPLPTSSQLDSFEKLAGFALPQSYRDFVLVFGPGEFSVSLRISAPGYLQATDTSYDLAIANEGYKLDDADLKRFPAEMHTMMKRLFYFGYIDGRDWLAWDVNDVRVPGSHEYAIYRVSLRSATVIASTFKELVETVCDRLFAPKPDWDEEEMGPQRVFV
jgi:SMI1 / KNR4 family (SUKH-1)